MEEFIITADLGNGILDDKNFDNGIIGQLNPIYLEFFYYKKIPKVKRVIIDLRGIEYANPYGALGIVMICKLLYGTFNQKVNLLLPTDDKGIHFSSWMDALGFLKAVGNITNIKGYTPILTVNLNPNFIPITKISTEENVYEAINEIEERVQSVVIKRLKYTKEEAYRFVTIMSELCQNLFYHSAPEGEEPWGYMAMQAYNECLKFAVMDLGIGIPESLKPRYKFTDDQQAIKLACEAGTTSNEEERGLGLYRTVEIIKQARGYLNIRSGTAKFLLTPQGEYYAGSNDIFSPYVYFWGTQIGIYLPKKISKKKEE